MGVITCKFGGTSLADVDQVRRAADIVGAKAERRFIVPSAPGKRTPEDRKITDLLYTWYSIARQGLSVSEVESIIAERFQQLANGLGVQINLDEELAAIAKHAAAFETADFMASRGEYLNGRLLAAYLGAEFVDPVEVIRFDAEGNLDHATYDGLAQRMTGKGRYIVPGFYGARPDGRVKTFSRGGSDITGAIVARATHSELYENWTDVSGFRRCDPTIVPDAARIDVITYQELRELSYMGARVLHDEAIYPVREPGIPINIRNTNDPEDPGTLIVDTREISSTITGIAGRGGFSMISIMKALMNKERGFARRVLSVLEEHDISLEHMPTGIDTISLIVQDEELADKAPAVLSGIQHYCQPDDIGLTTDLAIIAVVGEGMVSSVGTAARIFNALAAAEVNISVIDQGSSEINIIIGVLEADLARAVRAIHGAFDDRTG